MLPLLGLAIGAASGFAQAKEHDRELARQKEQDDWVREERNQKRQEWQQSKALQSGLMQAAQPAMVEDKGTTIAMADGQQIPYQDADVAGSDFRMMRRAGEATGQPVLAQTAQGIAQAPKQEALMNGQSFGSLAEARKAAGEYDSPDAVTKRQAQVYQRAGNFEKATALRDGLVKRQREEEDHTEKQRQAFRKRNEEGVFDAAMALNRGDGQAAFDAFNSTGKYKLKDVPVLQEVVRDMPGMGKVPTYNATFTVIHPDGKEEKRTVNSLDLLMRVMPPKDMWESMRKNQTAEDKENDKDSAYGRENRLMLTTLFSNANSQLTEDKRALRALQQSSEFMYGARTPGSPQAQQLADLTASIREKEQQVAELGRRLSGGSGEPAEKPAAAPAGQPPAAKGKQGAIPAPTSKAEYEKLPKGTLYRHPIKGIVEKG